MKTGGTSSHLFLKEDFMELYIHIPFCVRKCLYCDFLSFPMGEETWEAYKKALIRDIRNQGIQYRDKSISSIFIGGGTPSLMPLGFYKDLFTEIRNSFSVEQNAEITIECNPGTVNKEKLLEYREAGMNRLSFGLQSADENELKLLGRIHTFDDYRKSMDEAIKAGFENINTDIMMNLPEQTEDSVIDTLKKVLEWKPKHLSVYSLILEEGTPFYETYHNREDLLPDEETCSDTYLNAVKFLEENGYRQYEISNFAVPGYECRHNMGYWTREEYLGIGLGASGLVGNVRRTVTSNFGQYLEGLRYETEESLTEKDVFNEIVMLGLRTTNGIDWQNAWKTLFPNPNEAASGEAYKRFAEKVRKYREEGFLEEENTKIHFTKQGFLVSNPILADLILD